MESLFVNIYRKTSAAATYEMQPARESKLSADVMGRELPKNMSRRVQASNLGLFIEAQDSTSRLAADVGDRVTSLFLEALAHATAAQVKGLHEELIHVDLSITVMHPIHPCHSVRARNL